MSRASRYAVLRVPITGRKALIVEPNDFATQAEAEGRIAQIEAPQHSVHHTHLEVFVYSGNLYQALDKAEIVY